MSSTHNESRLAACPLSGVPGRVRAPCQLIPRRVGKCAALFGRNGQGAELRLGTFTGLLGIGAASSSVLHNRHGRRDTAAQVLVRRLPVS